LTVAVERGKEFTFPRRMYDFILHVEEETFKMFQVSSVVEQTSECCQLNF